MEKTKTDNGGEAKPDGKLTRDRGKAHPAFSLGDALLKAEELQQKARRQYVPVAVACGFWGYKPTSSTASRCVATLLSYGLIEDQGELEKKQIRVSEIGDTLIRHPTKNSPDYLKLLREAALKPKVHSAIFEKYKEEKALPTDDTVLQWTLEKEIGLSNFAVQDYFLDVLRDTFTLANVFGDATIEATPAEPPKVAPPGGQIPPASVARLGGTPPPASKETPMAAAAPGAEVRNQPLPLLSGEAVLSYPHPMTDEDFEWLLQMLQKFRKKLVVAPAALGVPTGMGGLAIGDSVQWTSLGVDQFEEPRRIVRFQDSFVFVEGTHTGLPIAEVHRP